MEAGFPVRIRTSWSKSSSSQEKAEKKRSYRREAVSYTHLLSHYVDSGYAGSYDVDNGNRKPSWEKKGYGPDDAVTDWNM